MDWRVQARSLYKMYIPTEDDLSKPRGYLLLEAEADGAVHGNMQLAVHGDDPITARFNTEDLFLDPELAGYEVSLEELPAAIKPQPNSSTTVWADFRDLVAKSEVAVAKDGQEAREPFLQLLDRKKKENYKNGAVIRWAIRAEASQAVILGLQGLPASLAYIRTKAQFSLDNCPAILLAAVPLEMTMSKAGLVVGPPPILFTAAPADTYRNLIEDPTPAVEGNIMNYTAELLEKHGTME
jgi:hypothetical protein